jgi:hypothetical protein
VILQCRVNGAFRDRSLRAGQGMPPDNTSLSNAIKALAANFLEY